MPCEDGRDPGPIVLRRDLESARTHSKHLEVVFDQQIKSYVDMLTAQCQYADSGHSGLTDEVQRWWNRQKAEVAKRHEAEMQKQKIERAKKTDQYLQLKKELGL